MKPCKTMEKEKPKPFETPFHLGMFFGRGCGSVGRVVASYTRGPQSESSRWHFLIQNIIQNFFKFKVKNLFICFLKISSSAKMAAFLH